MALCDSDGDVLFDEQTINIYSQIPLRALNVASVRCLSRYLNLSSKTLVKSGLATGIPSDWTGLAELTTHFDMRDILNFKERQEDPTEAVVSDWMSKEDATVEKLVRLIFQLERTDLLEDLKPCLQRDVQNFLKRQEKKYPTPLQVPEVSEGESMHNDTEMMTIYDEKDKPAMFDAFVCAAKDDITFVRKLIRTLEGSYGLKLCVSARDLLAGDSHTLTAAVIHQRCRRMVIVLSPAFCDSAACDFQVKFAQTLSPGSRTKKLIPIIYKTCNEIPYVLRHISPMDYTRAEHIDWFWDRLGKTLRLPLTWQNSEIETNRTLSIENLDSLTEEVQSSSTTCSPMEESVSPFDTVCTEKPSSTDSYKIYERKLSKENIEHPMVVDSNSSSESLTSMGKAKQRKKKKVPTAILR